MCTFTESGFAVLLWQCFLVLGCKVSMDGDAEKCPEAEKKYFLGCGAPKFVGPCSSEWILDTVKRRKAITAQYKET